MDPTLITTTEIITKFITVTVTSTVPQGGGAVGEGGVGEIAQLIAGMDPLGVPFGLLFVYLITDVYKRLVPCTYAGYPGWALAVNATASAGMAFLQLVFRYDGHGWRGCVGLALATLPVATAYFLGAWFAHEKVRGPISEWLTLRNSPVPVPVNYTPPERLASEAQRRVYMPEVVPNTTEPFPEPSAPSTEVTEDLTPKEPQW